MAIHSEFDAEKTRELVGHAGHKIEIAVYAGGASVCIECLKCCEVLIEFQPQEQDEYCIEGHDGPAVKSEHGTISCGTCGFTTTSDEWNELYGDA